MFCSVLLFEVHCSFLFFFSWILPVNRFAVSYELCFSLFLYCIYPHRKVPKSCVFEQRTSSEQRTGHGMAWHPRNNPHKDFDRARILHLYQLSLTFRPKCLNRFQFVCRWSDTMFVGCCNSLAAGSCNNIYMYICNDCLFLLHQITICWLKMLLNGNNNFPEREMACKRSQRNEMQQQQQQHERSINKTLFDAPLLTAVMRFSFFLSSHLMLTQQHLCLIISIPSASVFSSLFKS